MINIPRGGNILILLVLTVLCIVILSSSVSATIGPPDFEDGVPWYYYVSPELPETGNCNEDIFHDIDPYDGEWDVNVEKDGVQICVNITPSQGCIINVTLQYLNYSEYFDVWLDWCDEQYWGPWWNISEWGDNIDWDNRTSPYNNSFWHNFTSATGINTTGEICGYNDNVSCKIENDFTTEWSDWRINWTMNCSGIWTSGNCYYYFEPEYCPVIQYIYPPSPNGTICPCCSEMCIGVVNTDGNPMNITFYRNDTQFEDFYQVNKLSYVSNGTYCFCIDGHINNSQYYPMRFDETYHWYVNITDTVTEDYMVSDTFTFRTYPNTIYCPCGPDDLIDMGEELEWDTDTIRDDAWIIGLVIILLGFMFYFTRRR